MSRIVIFFATTLLLTIGCGKSDSGSDTPPPSIETKVTTETLLGTWQVQEVEYTDGKKLSGYPTEAQNCIKKSQFIFSKTTLTDILYTYDINEKKCEEEQGTLLYTLEGNSLFLTVESEKFHYGTVTIKDNTLSIALNEKVQQNTGTRTIVCKKVSTNAEAPAEKKATAIVSVSENIGNEISVAIAERSFLAGGSVVILEEESFVQGKAFLDVKEYIGKELYFILQNKSTRENVSDEVKKLITEGDNAVSLVYNAKVYTANITVNQNNAPLANQKVYALNDISISVHSKQ